MIDRWIAEATECDFKVALEVKKPKSWLKSVSAFANGIGGTLFFGIDDDRNVIGLSDAQTNAETISRLIKERITPYPSFVLAPERESGKDILVLSVSSGRSTPYYYKADGIMEAYLIRTACPGLEPCFFIVVQVRPLRSKQKITTEKRRDCCIAVSPLSTWMAVQKF